MENLPRMTGRFFFGCRTGAGNGTEEVKGMKKRKVVMDARDAIDRSLTRVAYQILEKNKGVEDLVLVGIRTGGVFLAERLRRKISEIEGGRSPAASSTSPSTGTTCKPHTGEGARLGKTDIPFSLNGKRVVLVDDVLSPGGRSAQPWTP